MENSETAAPAPPTAPPTADPAPSPPTAPPTADPAPSPPTAPPTANPAPAPPTAPPTANPAPAPPTAPPTANPAPAPPTAPPTANPTLAPPTANAASIANFFRFLLYAAIPLSILLTFLHCSGCVHPSNPFALPRTFNFTAPAPEPMARTASPPGEDLTASPLFVPPVPEPTASPPIVLEPDVRPVCGAESYHLTARKLQPGRSNHPPATRSKHPPATGSKHSPATRDKKGDSPNPPAKNKTGESPTGESSPTPIAPHTTHSIPEAAVLVLYEGTIGIFIPIAPVCATGISILLVDTLVNKGDAINNYLANLDQAHGVRVLVISIIGEGMAIIVPYVWPENQLTTSLSMILLVATIAFCCLFGDLKLVEKVVGAASCLTMIEIAAFLLKKNWGNLCVAVIAEGYCIFSFVLVTRENAPPLYRRL